MWQTSESRRRVLALDESTSLLGKQTHVGSENRKSYYKVLDRRVFVNVQTNDDDFTTIPQFKKISKNINTHINTKTSRQTNFVRWIWTLSPNSLLQNTKAKPWIHCFIVATTCEFRHLLWRLNRKGENILTQQWIPNEKQGKNRNVIKSQKDCIEAPMLFSESGKEVQIFLIEEREKKKELRAGKQRHFPKAEISSIYTTLKWLTPHTRQRLVCTPTARRGPSFGICSLL